MKLRNFMRSTACVITAMTVAFPHPALAQEVPQCTLDQISQALNSLECTVAGSFISAQSLVKAISDTCSTASDADLCHACFRKNGGKVGPAVKALVKVKVLAKSQASAFRIALVTAEETICSAKEETDDSEDSEESYQGPRDQQSERSTQPSRPNQGGENLHGTTPNRSTGETTRPQRPAKPERPEEAGNRSR